MILLGDTDKYDSIPYTKNILKKKKIKDKSMNLELDNCFCVKIIDFLCLKLKLLK